MDTVQFFDTTLRDGEQSPGFSMNQGEKLRLARKLDELGVDVIEAGFPVASSGELEAVRAVAAQIQRARVAALARARREDVEAALTALEPAARPRLHIFLATSDLHLQAKLRISRQEALDAVSRWVRYGRQHCAEVEFSAEDASRSDIRFLLDVLETAAEAGATILNIPDTVGFSTPEEYGAIFHRVRSHLGRTDEIIFSAHCHNDLGMAVANSLAAVRAGARQVECTINGIGERAGNCSLEEIVMVMKTRHDRFPFTTGIHTEHLFPASQMLASVITFGPQPNKAIVGANAFAHEAGIHQDGYLKERTTYEIIDPKSVGVPEGKLVLGKHSGRHALKQRCEHLGFSLTKDELDLVYTQFTTLADRKKGILDEEIASLIVAAGHAARPTFAGK